MQEYDYITYQSDPNNRVCRRQTYLIKQLRHPRIIIRVVFVHSGECKLSLRMRKAV